MDTPKKGETLVVMHEVTCARYLHESTRYPRPGYMPQDAPKFTFRPGDRVLYVQTFMNYYGEYWRVQKAAGDADIYDLWPECFEQAPDGPALMSWRREGYFNIRAIQGHGWCGLLRFIYTVGLCVGLANDGTYFGRYCFHEFSDAFRALFWWDGNGDPPGDWVKYKGKDGERARVPDEFS